MRRAGALLSALLLSTAQAHPVDEVVQGAYLTLVSGAVKLELDITPGSAVAGKVLGPLDANGDKRISDAEARAFAGRVLAQSTLTLDGKKTNWTLEKLDMPPYENLATGNAILKIYASAPSTELAGAHTLTYTNTYQPVKSQWMANIFLQPGGWQYAVTGQSRSNDGQRLTVQYTAKKG